jgi:hypothetical protein
MNPKLPRSRLLLIPEMRPAQAPGVRRTVRRYRLVRLQVKRVPEAPASGVERPGWASS